MTSRLDDLLVPSDAAWKVARLDEREDRAAADERGETEAADFEKVVAQPKARYLRS